MLDRVLTPDQVFLLSFFLYILLKARSRETRVDVSSFMALWSTGTIKNGVFFSKSDEYIFASNERTSLPFFFLEIYIFYRLTANLELESRYLCSFLELG